MESRTFHLLQRKLFNEAVWKYPIPIDRFCVLNYSPCVPVEKSCQISGFVLGMLICCVEQSLIDGQHARDVKNRMPRFMGWVGSRQSGKQRQCE